MYVGLVAPHDLTVGAADPEDALRRAERLFDAAEQSGIDLRALDATGVRIATLACQDAPYLATLLVRDPTRLVRVARDPYVRREKPREVLAAELARRTERAATAAELKAALRAVRGDELVRLGARELELGLDTEVGRELARLADVCFDAAIAFHDDELRAKYGAPIFTDDAGVAREARLAVIGMGKLGGEELNFASDVDVIYVYSSDQGSAGELTLQEYFAKLCAAVSAALSEVTDDGIVFRIDLRLRPEGSRGSIASSLAQLERYYEAFGRPWERQAWIKARPCAGDPALGAEIMTTLRPFVFPRHTAPTVLDDVRELNRRIKRELVQPRRSAGFDVKNGEGGIREIEFFVQALQLVHAGKNPRLRARGTLSALDQLLFNGLVTDDEHRALWRAYRWLRHVEHVLQLEAGLQTQTVPMDDAARLRFAKRLGYADNDAFVGELADHTAAVGRLFATLGADADDKPDKPDIAAVLGGELDPIAEAAALARLGFADVPAASAELARARRNAGSPLAADATDRSARVGAALLAEIATSADPDQALRFLGDLIARRGEQWSVWRLLDEQPAIARLVGSILGASAYLARMLVDTPELIDVLVSLGTAAPTRSVEQVAADLSAALARADGDDPEAMWSAIAEVKATHVLRVGLADFAGALDPLAVCAELTAIAEACLQRALSIVETELAKRHGRPSGGASLAVLGLGKLGGRELGYAADLDVIFVYATNDDALTDGAHPLTAAEWFARVAQRLIGALHQRTPRGPLYEVDTRLRPSGSAGLLVTSIGAWFEYHEKHARLWERQALLKLRRVAGDARLGASVEHLAYATAYYGPPGTELGDFAGVPADSTPPDPAAPLREPIAVMRDKIEKEHGHSRDDLKFGAGGVIDVEFAAQLLQLAWGRQAAALVTTSTSEALCAAAELPALAPLHDDLTLLAQGYRFLRSIEHRMRVVHDQPIHRLPHTADELDKLARRSGFPDGTALLERVRRWQHDIRAAYLRVMHGS